MADAVRVSLTVNGRSHTADVEPRLLIDVMASMPAIVENCFSSGVATAEAIVSGLAPGSEAWTLMVGKSIVGRSLTGSRL